MKTPFVWLGSGRTKKWDVDDRAKLLDQAAKAGLPVPPGAVLLDEFFQLVVDEGVVVKVNGRFSAPDPQWLAETLFDGIRFPRMDTAVAVRVAFPNEDNRHPPRLAVNLNDPAQLSQSLCELWSSIPDGTLRRDLLIMEMVGDQTAAAKTAGSALTHTANETDEIQMEGEAPPLYLPQLGAWRRPAPDLPDYAQRLQQLLRGVRRTFGKGVWGIDWMDDGRICWLLQVKDLAGFDTELKRSTNL